MSQRHFDYANDLKVFSGKAAGNPIADIQAGASRLLRHRQSMRVKYENLPEVDLPMWIFR
jgi:hypothetical protein